MYWLYHLVSLYFKMHSHIISKDLFKIQRLSLPLQVLPPQATLVVGEAWRSRLDFYLVCNH